MSQFVIWIVQYCPDITFLNINNVWNWMSGVKWKPTSVRIHAVWRVFLWSNDGDAGRRLLDAVVIVSEEGNALWDVIWSCGVPVIVKVRRDKGVHVVLCSLQTVLISRLLAQTVRAPSPRQVAQYRKVLWKHSLPLITLQIENIPFLDIRQGVSGSVSWPESPLGQRAHCSLQATPCRQQHSAYVVLSSWWGLEHMLSSSRRFQQISTCTFWNDSEEQKKNNQIKWNDFWKNRYLACTWLTLVEARDIWKAGPIEMHLQSCWGWRSGGACCPGPTEGCRSSWKTPPCSCTLHSHRQFQRRTHHNLKTTHTPSTNQPSHKRRRAFWPPINFSCTVSRWTETSDASWEIWYSSVQPKLRHQAWMRAVQVLTAEFVMTLSSFWLAVRLQGIGVGGATVVVVTGGTSAKAVGLLLHSVCVTSVC